MEIKKSLKLNISNIKQQFNNSKDIIVKEFNVNKLKVAIIYLKGMTDTLMLTDFVIKPMQQAKKVPNKNIKPYIINNIITFPEIANETNFNTIVEEISKGKVCLFFDGSNQSYLIELDKYKERSLTEPPTSAVLKGPREGFNENLKTNLSVIRKILATDKLDTEMITVGDVTKTQICVMYLKGIATKSVVKQVVNKIKKISIDGIIDSYYIAEFLAPRKYSIFKQIGSAEKPDVVAAKMLEGRVAILVDGSPLVLTVPFILLEDFQASDDYYSNSAHASFVRCIRIISFFVTILLPGMYIAIQLNHYKALPLKFLVTIVNSTQGLPLSPFAEIIFVLILFEILYEASLRMPEYLGIALSVVGALILGDTAVKAGIISPPAVMIVALSGITLYTIPDQAQQLSLLRFIFTMAGGLLGFYGLVLMAVFFVIYLNDFDSYGSPYLAPISPYISSDAKDSIFKKPLPDMIMRPRTIPNVNHRRIKKWQDKLATDNVP